MTIKLKSKQPSCSDDRAQLKRYLVKSSEDCKPLMCLSEDDESLESILANICKLYPDIWRVNVLYYFYVEMGNYYYPIEDHSSLRDKDVLIVTTIEDLEDKPKSFNLGALFASLKDDVQLKPHQEEGVRKMIEMEKMYESGILADEMGLGKTLQVISMVLRLQPINNTRCMTLVVVPSLSIAEQWGEEIRTKTKSGSLPYFIYENNSNVMYLLESIFRVVIMTYDRLRADFRKRYVLMQHETSSSTATANVSESIFEIDWHRIIFDEAHIVKGGTMLHDSITRLNGKFRWCITGTPLQNSIRDLYTMFDLLGVQLSSFKRRRHNYLREMLKKYMIRRKKYQIIQSDVFIPESHEKIIYLEFTKPERALYDYLERALAKRISEKSVEFSTLFPGTAPICFVMYLRLKQACVSHWILLDKFPELIPLTSNNKHQEQLSSVLNTDEGFSKERSYFQDPTEFEEAMDIINSYHDQFGNSQEPIDITQLQRLKLVKHSAKIKWLIQFLRRLFSDSKNDKVIVVSQFVSVLTKIGETFKSCKIVYKAYHGELNNAERRHSLNAFKHDSKVRVLIMCLKSGNTGLNLQKANHMVFMDKWWNPATMEQASGRINRINQPKDTFIYTLVVKDTIEETLIDSILKRKEELFKSIVDGEFDSLMIKNNETINLHEQN